MTPYNLDRAGEEILSLWPVIPFGARGPHQPLDSTFVLKRGAENLSSKEVDTMKSLIRWDPFKIMGRWDPFDELRRMQREMDRLFERVLGSETLSGERIGWLPAVESFTKDGELVFRVELPGVDPKDLDVRVTDRELIIKGERKAEKEAKEENYLYKEISYGAFERRFMLPEGVRTEDLKAKFINGILEITVPAPAIPKARKVEIETKETKQIEADVKKVA